MLRQEAVPRAVKNYLRSLPVRVDEAFLFGSSAKGDRLVESDIDLIVISEDFKGMSFPKRFLILQKNWKKKIELEAFGFTREEFEILKGRSLVVQEALEYGIKLKT